MGISARFGCFKPRFLMLLVVFVVVFGSSSWWGNSPSGSVMGAPILGGSHPPPGGTIELHVQLSPVIAHASVERCIDFVFHEDCNVEPVQCSVVVAFGDPSAPGMGTATIDVGASCQVDIEQVFAVSAVDLLHTLRSVGDVEHAVGTLIVSFEGDPEDGGHWLVGGNLDGWHPDTSPANADTINILDFGVFVSQYLRSYPDGSTDCGTAGPHADINGDGVVNGLDFTFIVDNFLAEADQFTCIPFAGNRAPLAEISVADLIELGLERLVVADLNRDGWVDHDDMILFRRKRLR